MLVTHGCVEGTAEEAGQVGQCGAERTRGESSREDGEVGVKGHLGVRQAWRTLDLAESMMSTDISRAR